MSLGQSHHTSSSGYLLYFSSYEGLYGQSGTMGKSGVDAFNCFQNKHFQEVGTLCLQLVSERQVAHSLCAHHRRCGADQYVGKCFPCTFIMFDSDDSILFTERND